MAYAGVADLALYLGIGEVGDNALLSALLTRAQKQIDNWTRRTFEATADSTRYFDALADVDGQTLHLDEDLLSVTTLTNGDATVVASSSYVFEPRNRTPYYAIHLKSNADIAWTYDDTPEGAISIVGKWAYSLTAPADIVHATIRLAAYMYRQKDAGVYDVVAIPDAGVIQVPQGIPKDVVLILKAYRRLV